MGPPGGGYGVPAFAPGYGAPAPYGGGYPPMYGGGGGGGFPGPEQYGGYGGGAPGPYGPGGDGGGGPVVGSPGRMGGGGPPPGPWQEYHDDQGRAYYYNAATGVTQWDKPPGL